MRYEITLTGTGGQGIVLMGTILAEAVASNEGLFISQTQSYDPAVRGGKAEASLVISDEEIDWPGDYRLDILLALSQEGYERHIGNLIESGLLIIDPELVNPGDTMTDTGGDSDFENPHNWKILEIPFRKLAQAKFKDERVINMVALGVLSKIAKYISQEAVRSAISAKFKGKLLELNLAAFDAGTSYSLPGNF
jgi:2-oxoglutarate ferredoxin oxidoreductase subunit gamma